MSTHREIEEVYLSDIIKIQKMTKSIVAESLGEINKMGGEMKYCCKKFEELITKYPDTLYVYSKSRGGDGLWYLDIDIQKEQAHDSIRVVYCPFCGKELKSGK